jgi:hypothetical protein
MTKRDFFRIVIKIYGLYSLIITLFTIIPRNFTNLMIQYTGIMILVISSVTLISVGLFLFLLFKTDSIINLLKLDKGFDDDHIQFGALNNENILKIAILILGGFLVVEYVPIFLLDCINAFRMKTSTFIFNEKPIDYSKLSIEAVNVLIGYLLLANYKYLSKFFDKE